MRYFLLELSYETPLTESKSMDTSFLIKITHIREDEANSTSDWTL